MHYEHKTSNKTTVFWIVKIWPIASIEQTDTTHFILQPTDKFIYGSKQALDAYCSLLLTQ